VSVNILRSRRNRYY